MKCVILAAGYATRLYPLTRDTPKPLLRVGDRSILDLILDKVDRVPGLSEILLVSNARFFARFEAFAAGRGGGIPIRALDDGSTDNENRLGALADLDFAIKAGALDEDLLVLAGDNLFDFELSDFAAYFRKKGRDCITTHRLEDLEALRRTGVVELAEDGRVLSFEEKPAEPRSSFAVPPFYLYRRETLPLLGDYLARGGNPDAPGNFIPWLIERAPVYAFAFRGRRYDIGNLESYAEACKLFGS